MGIESVVYFLIVVIIEYLKLMPQVMAAFGFDPKATVFKKAFISPNIRLYRG